jgi:phage terminase large subunit-like protein
MLMRTPDPYVYDYGRFDYTVAERTIAFIEAVCIIPEGTHVGKALVLEDFQRKYIRDVFKIDRATGRRVVRQGLLSISRKNGKTAFSAALVIAALSGPLAAQNAEISSIALTRDQAAVIYRYASGYVKMNHRLYDRIKMVDSKKHLIDLQLGSNYTALSADHRSQLGKSPAICLWDEAGAFRQDRELYDSQITGQGAHPNPLMLVLSTESPSDQDVFAEMVDYCEEHPEDETEYLMRYTLPEGDDPYLEANWYKANPALGKFLNIEDFRLAAKKAKLMPGARSAFLNLRLNQRVDADEAFMSREAWQDTLHDRPPTMEDLRGRDVSLGIDLAERRDLSALVFISHDDDYEEILVVPHFFMPKGSLLERQEEDKVNYTKWAEMDLLVTPPGDSLDFEWLAQWMIATVEKYDLNVVTGGADPYRLKNLRKELEKAGAEIMFDEVEDFQQGFISMSPAVDVLESEVYKNRLWHGNHPILTWNIANCVISVDAVLNRKLDKKRSFNKIDGAVALAMALQTMELDDEGGLVDSGELLLL